MRAMRVLQRGKLGWASGAAVAAMLSLSTAALAISVLLPPGGTVAVPSTTAALEPDLAGVVIHDAVLPFTIKNPAGGMVCAGQLQDRVVRSSKTGLLHFYYRIRATSGPGAISQLTTAGFPNLALRVAYRADGLGTVPPRRAHRTSAPGAQVMFTLPDPTVSCAKHEESRFIFIKTPAKAFRPGGVTRVIATTGAVASVPTVMP